MTACHHSRLVHLWWSKNIDKCCYFGNWKQTLNQRPHPQVYLGDFHYSKGSKNFGYSSNGKIHLSFFWLEYSGSPLEVVRIFQTKFDIPFFTNQFFDLIREFGNGIKNGQSHSYWLAWFNWKMLFHFPPVFPLTSDQSVWHNGSTPCVRKEVLSIYLCQTCA